MAKRKRLSPATLTEDPDPGLETKAYLGWAGSGRRSAPPIAEVAGDSAAKAALEEVAGELTRAKAEGRMVVSLPLESIVVDHLVRDRLAQEDEEMASLVDSLRARGQQTPIEVTDLGGGRYGLIAGWRRVAALKALFEATGDSRFAKASALIRTPEGAPAAYLAMVEENEIRAPLSFYERARVAVQAARLGVYSDTKSAVKALFAAARAPKRSKILSFTVLVEALDDVLRFPAAIPEHLGLKLVAAIEAGQGEALRRALAQAEITEVAAERNLLEAALRSPSRPEAGSPLGAGVEIIQTKGKLTLQGPGVTSALIADLRAWLAARG